MMVQTFKLFQRHALAFCLFGLFPLRAFAQEDPPSRVARLNYINGQVSMEPAGVDDWSPAAVNRPFSIGDYLYTDQGSVAELHLDIAVIRMGEFTNFGFLNLNDQVAQLRLTEGEMYLRIRNLGENDVFEVDTPNAAITLLRNGLYRINVDPKANTTFVVARSGEAEITGGGQAFTLTPGNSASLSGTDQLAFDVQSAPEPDSFDTWCSRRDVHESHLQSARYVPPTLIGYEDLDDYGNWTQSQDYGAVWYPRSVEAGWAPYHNGHWAWVEPWGWTWVDDAPWGFAPFHYGRWIYSQDRWGWTPGPEAEEGYGRRAFRPVYAPAMVAWLGGAHWGVSLAIGGGQGLGWVPLGYGEVYTPSYTCSRPYFNNVNVNNTRIEKTVNITNIYNNVYVNKTAYNQTYVNGRAPNAIAAMPQSAFASGRSVNQAGYAVRPADFARMQPAQAAILAPPVAPTRQALAPRLGQPTVRPAAQISQRQVIARNTPPTQTASFTAQQSFVQQHVGQPHNFAAMHQALPQQGQVTQVRQAPQARVIAVVPGQQLEHGLPSATGPSVQPGREIITQGERNARTESNRAGELQRGGPGNRRPYGQQPVPAQTTPGPSGANPSVSRPAASTLTMPQHGVPPNSRADSRGQGVQNAPRANDQVQPRESLPRQGQPPARPAPSASNPTVSNPTVSRPVMPQRGVPPNSHQDSRSQRVLNAPRDNEQVQRRESVPPQSQRPERNDGVGARAPQSEPRRAEPPRPVDQPRRAEPGEPRPVQPQPVQPRAEERPRNEPHPAESHGTPPPHEDKKPDHK